jgi:hypothetical protein
MSFGQEMLTFECGPDAVLYCASSGQLMVLNDTAAVVSRALTNGVPLRDICRGLAAATRADEQQVERDVRQLVETWQELRQRRPRVAQTEPLPVPTGAGHVAPAAAPRYRQRYRLADLLFEVQADAADDRRAADSVLEHLQHSFAGNADAVLRIVRRRGRWLLLRTGTQLDECRTLAGVAPMLHANTLMLAFTKAPRFAALHAGAVLRDGQCVVLPAASGHGKSTLTAALVAEGYGYLTDDFVILTEPSIRACPVPLGLGLKEGSWAVLADRIPALFEQRVHVRADGKRIRYLPLPPAAPNECVPVRALVYPQYRPSATTNYRRIRPAEALTLLAAAGYETRLSGRTVRSLVEWVCAVPSYELVYGDLDHAVAAMNEITR